MNEKTCHSLGNSNLQALPKEILSLVIVVQVLYQNQETCKLVLSAYHNLIQEEPISLINIVLKTDLRTIIAGL